MGIIQNRKMYECKKVIYQRSKKRWAVDIKESDKCDLCLKIMLYNIRYVFIFGALD